MGRKKKDAYLFPVLLILGIIILVYALVVYSSNPVNASTDWTSIIRVLAGSVAYIFILGFCFYGLTQTKTKNPLAIILIWGFLGVASSEFLGFLYAENIFSNFGYNLLEIQISIMVLCVLFGVLISVVKRR